MAVGDTFTTHIGGVNLVFHITAENSGTISGTYAGDPRYSSTPANFHRDVSGHWYFNGSLASDICVAQVESTYQYYLMNKAPKKEEAIELGTFVAEWNSGTEYVKTSFLINNETPNEVQGTYVSSHWNDKTPNGFLIQGSNCYFRANNQGEWKEFAGTGLPPELIIASYKKYKQNKKSTAKEATMTNEIKKSLQKFIADHGNTLFFIGVVVLLDHYLFDGALRDRLKATAEGILDSLPGGKKVEAVSSNIKQVN